MSDFDLTYAVARPVLFSLDAERAHNLTLKIAGSIARQPALLALTRALYGVKPDPILGQKVFGLDFDHPLGLAAGLDKDGEAIDFWAAVGFGFVELGTVTPGQGQSGNDKPRLERIVEGQGIVNRMGFNNRGAAHLATRLASRTTSVPCGANLGKAKATPLEHAPDDYEAALEAVWPHCDYVVVNVSSPNTPGLRDLQAVDSLAPLIERVMTVNQRRADESGVGPRPILLKIAPDLADEDVDAIADLAVGQKMQGIIATNTTLRHDLAARPPRIAGGLSGPALIPRALDLTRRLYRRLDGALPIVGVGGIRSADDAYLRIRAGATLVQLYTGLVFKGPALVSDIVSGLQKKLHQDGLESVRAAVGRDA